MTKTITFHVNLGESEWSDNVGAWRCDVLHVAGAEVVSMHSGSALIDPKKYRVEIDRAMIAPSEPEQRPKVATVFIRLNQELLTVEAHNQKTEESRARWTKWTIVSNLVAAALGAAGTFGAAVYGKASPASPVDPPSSASIALVAPSVSAIGAPAALPTNSAAAVTPTLPDPACPIVPRPELKISGPSFFMELARAPATLPDVNARVDAVANQVRGMLGDDWKDHLAQPWTGLVDAPDGTRRSAYSAGWYGMSKKNAEDICCFLRNRRWPGEQDGIIKLCKAIPADSVKPLPKTAASAK